MNQIQQTIKDKQVKIYWIDVYIVKSYIQEIRINGWYVLMQRYL